MSDELQTFITELLPLTRTVRLTKVIREKSSVRHQLTATALHAVVAWLTQHPTITVVWRDRSPQAKSTA